MGNEVATDARASSQDESESALTRAESWIDLVLARAAGLREAGVSSISIDGRAATFLPKEPLPPKFDDIKNDAERGGLPTLLDPASYPDGIVPGFEIERLSEEE